jgi:hypothetical protein
MLPSSASTTSNLAVTGVSGTVENRPARQVKLRNTSANGPARSPDEEPDPRTALAEIHQQVAGLLGRPGPVGMPGHAQDV